MSGVPSLRRQRRAGFCEFKASLEKKGDISYEVENNECGQVKRENFFPESVLHRTLKCFPRKHCLIPIQI